MRINMVKDFFNVCADAVENNDVNIESISIEFGSKVDLGINLNKKLSEFTKDEIEGILEHSTNIDIRFSKKPLDIKSKSFTVVSYYESSSNGNYFSNVYFTWGSED